MTDVFVGIDVQVKRGCPYAILNSDRELVGHGWFRKVDRWEHDLVPALNEAVELIRQLNAHGYAVAVGIDSPRQPLSAPRVWSCRRGQWQRDGTGSRYGRHCELVVKALGIANPQWTPPLDEAKDWMVLGFKLFEALDSMAEVHEVFPTASYHLLAGQSDATLDVSLPLSSLARGPKDFLDALMGAITVRAYCNGEGAEVGGGDGYGSIVLPCPLSPDMRAHPVHRWPGGYDLDFT